MKSNLSKCSECPLENQKLVFGETNCSGDIEKVDLLILAEAPANEEIKQDRPLVGTAGKVFRQAFKESGLETLNHFITNVVLCSNIVDGKTVNPPAEAVELCKPNWKKIIEKTKPKIILLLGSIPMNVFGLGETGISKLRGFHKHEEFGDIFLTFHPSYVQRNGGITSEVGRAFLDDFNQVFKFLNKTSGESLGEGVKVVEDQQTPYYFQLPNWCYDKNVCLMDCQYIYETNSILYIFRDSEGKKIFHKESATDDYCYILPGVDLEDSPMTIDISKTSLVLGRSLDRLNYNYGIYEGDVRKEVKRTIDYRYVRKEEECEVKLRKLFVDIEVYGKGDRTFPDPREAPNPINAISFKFNDGGPVNVWIASVGGVSVNKDLLKEKLPENIEVKVFSSESKLLTAFTKMVRESDVDSMWGWNFLGFDMPTIFNRMRKVGVDPNKMSPVGITSFDIKKYGRVFIFGMHVGDMLDLYKELTYSVEESYKLDFIANKHLKTGKLSYSGTLDSLYEKDIYEFIKYSGTDTMLLEKLDDRLGHIDLKFELVRICSSTWKIAETTMGLVDPLCLSYVKNLNLACRNSLSIKTEESIPGAYVRNPKAGRHLYVIDLDFSSLYPSVACSCNIGPNTYVAKISPTVAHHIIYNRDKIRTNSKSVNITYNPSKKSSISEEIKVSRLIELIEQNQWIVTAAGTIFKSHDEELSILYKIFTYLLGSRKQYKNMRDDYKRAGEKNLTKKYNNVQQSYKILANSIYGVLANFAFRFFNLDLATSITLTGQEIIKFSGYHLGYYMKDKKTNINPNFMDNYDNENIPYLLYTDTDSIFIAMGDYLLDKSLI